MIIISDTLVRFFLVTTVSATTLCGNVYGLEWKAANVDTMIEPAHNALAAPLVINMLPVERTLDLDFYRNTAYACGFSGNYTFLVIAPRIFVSTRSIDAGLGCSKKV